jgi:hypothetical protein
MMLSKCCSIAKIGTFSVTVIGVTLVLIGWAASAGIAQAHVKQVINYVMLVPQGTGGNLKVKPELANRNDNQCKKAKHPGCLLFERNTLVHIAFRVPGPKDQTKYCPDAKYVITKIEVTAKAADEGTNDSKGDFTGPFPLTGWLVENAFPAVDPDNGIIYEASFDVARTQELVTNMNDHDNSTEDPDVINSFWYRVTVTACAKNKDGTHATWVSDPRGDNEGKN